MLPVPDRLQHALSPRRKFLCAFCQSSEILMTFFKSQNSLFEGPFPSPEILMTFFLFLSQNFLFEGPLCPPSVIFYTLYVFNHHIIRPYIRYVPLQGSALPAAAAAAG